MRLSQLPAFFIPDISRRRANQSRDVVLLHVLRHVDRNQRIFIAEHELRQRLGKQRLTDTRRAKEQERAHRAMRVFQTRASATNRLGDGLDRHILRNNALVQFVFELEQPLRLFLLQPSQRHARHLGNDLSDHFLIDNAVHFLGPVAPLLLHLLFLGPERLSLIAQLRRLFVFRVLDGLVLLNRQPLDLFFQVRQILWLGHRA